MARHGLSPKRAFKGSTNVRRDGAKMRTCLPCSKPFLSTHAGNRMCPVCKDSLEAEIAA